MNKIGEDLEFWLGNVQIQPSKFEPLESGNDSVDKVNVSGSDSSKNQPHGLVSLSEYIENFCSKFSNKLVNKIHL